MKYKTIGVAGPIEILATAKFEGKPYSITSASVSAGSDGRKIAKAGTPLPTNNGSCEGILLYDVDVTDGDAVGTVIYEGTINTAKAQTHSGVTVASAAKGALPRVTFL